MKRCKKVLSLVLVMALVMSMSACGSKDDSSKGGSKDTIVIGGSGPLTGEAASYGNSVKNGAQIAIDEINEAGGVLGKKLKLVFKDDEATEEGAIAAYSQLKDQKTDIVLGTVTSGSCLAITKLTKQDKLLQITPSGSAVDCTKYDNAFRICFTDPLQGITMADFANKKGYKNAAVIFKMGDEYSTGMKDAFVEQFEKNGGKVVAAESFQEGAVDFSSQLTSVKKASPDVVFVPAYYQDVAKILDQAKKQSIETPFLGGDGWDGILGIDAVPENVNDCVFLSPFFAEDASANVKNFVEKYQKANNSIPDQFAADGYDGVYVIKAALEKAGAVDTDKLVKAMTEIEVEGVTGKMSFDASGEPSKEAKFIIIKDNKYQAYTED